MGAENIKVEAMKVVYGKAIAQVEKIICHANAGAYALTGKHFFFYDSAGVQHYAYEGTDPAIAGATGHDMGLSGGETAAAVATALAAVLGAVSGFDAVASGPEVTLTHTATGYASSAHDGKGTNGTKFGFQIVTQGESEIDIGCVEGDIEVEFEETFAEVKCHDTGTTPIAILKTGVSNVQITLAALETTKAKLKALMTRTGGSFKPENGTEVFGMGTFKNFENMFKFASKLRLHPVRLLDDDFTEDWTFHKAIPKLTGATFSGENPFTLPLTFQVFPDETKNSRVNYFSIGDGSQDLNK